MPQESIRRPSTTSDTLLCCLSNALNTRQQIEALTFCYSASRIDGYCIGWIPRAAYDVRHVLGELLVLYNNEDLVGFVMMSKVNYLQELRCLQVWVRRDARMILHGRKLIDTLTQIGKQRGATLLRLWCAEDLAANIFWQQIGFQKKGWRYGPATRARKHNLWVRPINPQPTSLAQLDSQPRDESGPPTPRLIPHPYEPATETARPDHREGYRPMLAAS